MERSFSTGLRARDHQEGDCPDNSTSGRSSATGGRTRAVRRPTSLPACMRASLSVAKRGELQTTSAAERPARVSGSEGPALNKVRGLHKACASSLSKDGEPNGEATQGTDPANRTRRMPTQPRQILANPSSDSRAGRWEIRMRTGRRCRYVAVPHGLDAGGTPAIRDVF